MKKSLTIKVTALLLVMVMCTSLCVDFAANAQNGSNLSNPRIEKDSNMEAGQKVTWDCVWFGSYPQAEVVPSANNYSAIEKGMLKKGDVVENSSLYNKLRNASGWNSNDDIIIEGKKYRRMKMSDATYTDSDSSYYQWSDPDTYHYFKYEPIKWRVLKVNGNQAFLLSDIALDDQKYNTEYESITWESSTLRSWLNGYGASVNKQGEDYSNENFIGSAFTLEERSAITDTSVINADNIAYKTGGGNNTTDKIFLMSESETYGVNATLHGFVTLNNTCDEARKCTSSTYAKAKGTWSGTSDAYKGNCEWWMRSPGSASDNAAYIDYDGYVINDGYYVSRDDRSVRAALNLNLSYASHTYAGTVCSNRTVNEEGGTGNDLIDDASFNLAAYKAKILSDTQIANSKIWKDSVSEERICEKLVKALEDKNGDFTAKAWKALHEIFSAADNPANMIDLSLKEYDMYEALIFSVLSDVTSDVYLDRAKDIEGKVSRIIGEFDQCAEIRKILQTTSNAGWGSLSQTGKEEALKIIKEEYSKTSIGKAGEFMGDVDKIMGAVMDIEEAVKYVASYVSMRQMNDSVKQVVKELYEQCPSNNRSLKYALEELYQTITSSNAQFVSKMLNGTVKIAGKRIVSFWVSVYWGEVKAKIIASNPNLLFLVASYGASTYVSNTLFNTDETVEKYFDMVTMNTFNSIAKNAYAALENQYKNTRTKENAEIYLSAADIIYRYMDADCSHAANYVSTLEESAIGKLKKFFGKTTIEDTRKSIESIQGIRRENYDAILTGWIHCLEDDGYAEEYPKYEELLMQSINKYVKSYQIACPVNVYVYDKDDNLVASVVNNLPKTYNDGIDIVVDGSVKNLHFTDDNKACRIQYEGTAQGEMDITVKEYKDENIVRTVNFNKLDLVKGKIYTSDYTNRIMDNSGYYMEASGAEINADYDSIKAEGQEKYQVSIENGMLTRNGIPACRLEANENEKIEISAYVPKGYRFIRWSVVSGQGIIEDAGKLSTCLYVGNSACTLRAELEKVKDNQSKPQELKDNKVQKLKISGISKKIAAGKKIKLTAGIIPSNATNKAIKWTSGNKKVATVNNSGVVTMKKKSSGKTVTITATAQDGSGVRATYKIKSMKGVVKKVTISGKKTMRAGKALKLKAKVKATKNANKKLKWTSSNKKYAIVSASGKVKALKAGKGKKVKITAAATDGSGKKKSITIKIK